MPQIQKYYQNTFVVDEIGSRNPNLEFHSAPILVVVLVLNPGPTYFFL